MATLLLMPEVAAGDDGATLSSWSVAVGAAYRANDTIAVVETAKAAVDVDAEADGVVLRTLVAEGADVEVGEPIALLGSPGEQVADVDAVLAELGVADGVVGVPAPGAPEAVEPPPAVGVDGHEDAEQPQRVFSSPLARRLAREAGLDLADLVGTGPGGRVVRDDVRAAQAHRASSPPASQEPEPVAAQPVQPVQPVQAAAPAPAPEPAAGWTDVPHTRLRRALARRLTESVTTAPHFTVSGRAVVDRLLALRAEINGSTSARVSVNDLVVKAVAHAHTEVPAMNVVWTDDAVRRFDAVDVAVAVATPAGLVTPVVRGVQGLGVGAVAAATSDLVLRAREGRLQQRELEGGSITVSNLGTSGTRSFTAIINPPQAAILAVGAASPEPVVVDGSIVVASVLHLTASVDHRPVDGAVAAQWMRALVDVIEHPLGLLV
ncbi:dihydrolipoamide acetyltransferase family protein [Angustibacter aerolatus]